MILAVIHRVRSFGLPLLVGVALLFGVNAEAQTRKRKETRPANELAQLREEFIKATKDYKTSLAKLLAIYERNVTRTEEKLVQSQKLYAEGLISKNQLVEAETAVAAAKDKVNASPKSTWPMPTHRLPIRWSRPRPRLRWPKRLCAKEVC